MRFFALIFVVTGGLMPAACSSDPIGAIPALGGAKIETLPASRANAQQSLVYVGDEQASFIAVFNRSGTQIGEITKGLKYPTGLFVDGAHNLWVANQGTSAVLEFARGASVPKLILADGKGNAPEDLTICPNGDIFVANVIKGIAKYTGPNHHRSASLNYDAGQFTGVTCDAAGNVFATGVAGTNGTVFEFPHGRNAGAHLLPIFTPGNLGGIKPDNAGNILVGYPGGTVSEYTEAGRPTGLHVNAVGTDFALSRSGKLLLGGDQRTNEGVTETFPGGAPGITYKSNFERVLGVAFDPGQKGI